MVQRVFYGLIDDNFDNPNNGDYVVDKHDS